MGARYSDTITATSGAVIVGATVRAIDATGAYATLYRDKNLTASLGTSVESDDAGLVEFYVADGTYTITQTYNSTTRRLSNVPIYDIGAISARAVSVKDSGAKGDGTTDDTAAIQACFDANPNAEIMFPYGSYKCTASIVLVDASGRNFQGRIRGSNAAVTFTNSGNASDTDVAMQRGFAAYPVTNGAGGDTTGLRASKITGLTIHGPAHGASIYLANSQNVRIDVHTVGNRYGIAEECCININHDDSIFEDYTNAGIGFLMLSDTARVWYGSATPANTYWNDSPSIKGCGFSNSLTTQPLAHILDHGSAAESIRKAEGCYFYGTWSGTGAFTSTQYGIIARNAQWTAERCWFENTNYHIRILDTNALEGTGALAGVAGAEPSGTYAISNFVDGYSYNLKVDGCWFVRGLIEVNCTGVRGAVRLAGNVSQSIQNTGVNIKSNATSTAQVILDTPASIVGPVGSYTYTSLVNATYINQAPVLTSWTPTVSASTGTITTSVVNAAKYTQVGKWVYGRADVSITTNGTGAGSLQLTPPITAASNSGTAYGREMSAGGKAIQGLVAGSLISLWNYDNTYPGSNGARFIVNFAYEAA